LKFSDADSIGLNLSSIFKKNDYVILETNNQSKFGDVDKMMLADDKIIILDKRVTKTLLVFDKTGHFLYKLTTGNHKDGIFSSITDFTIDKITKQILVFSNEESLIYKYELRNGKFISYFRIRGLFDNIEFINDHTVMLSRDALAKYTDNQGYRICLFDSHGKYLNGWIYYSPNKNVNRGKIGKSSNYGNSDIYLSRLFTDTIYKIDALGKLQASYKFDFESFDFDRSKFSNLKSSFDINEMLRKKLYFTGDIFSNNKYLVLYFVQHSNLMPLFIDKKSNSMFRPTFMNDFDNVPPGVIKYMDDNIMVTSISRPDIEELWGLSSLRKNMGIPKIVELHDKLPLDSNPVLMFYKFK